MKRFMQPGDRAWFYKKRYKAVRWNKINPRLVPCNYCAMRKFGRVMCAYFLLCNGNFKNERRKIIYVLDMPKRRNKCRKEIKNA